MQTEFEKDLINADSLTLAQEAVKILIEKKGVDVKLFDVRETSAITDFYINVTGRSSLHVSSLADEMDFTLCERGAKPGKIEGKRGNSWLLIDYIDVIVNVFDKEARGFYDFERLLPKESMVDISDLVKAVDEKFSK